MFTKCVQYVVSAGVLVVIAAVIITTVTNSCSLFCQLGLLAPSPLITGLFSSLHEPTVNSPKF